MKLLKVYPDNPNERYISMAVEALEKGNIIIYPTDTLYALGCDALNNQAIEKICRIKKFKSDKTNLSIICKDISQVAEYARFNNDYFRLMKENTPGPFTFIFPALSKLPKAFKGRKTVGIRIPDSTIAQALIERLGHPLMTTSIERTHDNDYMEHVEMIAERYTYDVELLIDGGSCGVIPSTIVDCTENECSIVREGKGELRR